MVSEAKKYSWADNPNWYCVEVVKDSACYEVGCDCCGLRVRVFCKPDDSLINGILQDDCVCE